MWVFLGGFSIVIIKNVNIFILLQKLPAGLALKLPESFLIFCFSEALSEAFGSPSGILAGFGYLSREQLCEFWGGKIRKPYFPPSVPVWTRKALMVFTNQRDLKL